nr:alpha-1,2-fucosyltransferase [Bacteroides intestinalis]
MDKVIVRLWGGIGNQLFQYSFGEYLRNTKSVRVEYDCNSFGNSDKLRKLEIESAVGSIPITTENAISKYTGVINRVIRCIYNISNKFVLEESFSEEKFDLLKQRKGEVYLQGYWQKQLYASWALNSGVLNLSKMPLSIELQDYYQKITTEEESISLHIRRGDYFTPRYIKKFGVCSPKYYQNSIAYLQNKIKRNIKIFIFSDDPQWVIKNIKLPSDSIFVKNYKVPQASYIYLMSLCKYNIISNSSFSWWGAFLNRNPNKMVISPEKWTLNSDKTLALSEWVKLSV